MSQGRLVRTLMGGTRLEPGIRGVLWDGWDDGGREMASGVYLCRVHTDAQATSLRMILTR